MIAESVYILCALTSFACAVLLLRKYRRRRVGILLWSSLCFFGLTVNNILMYIDIMVIPYIDFSLWRNLTGAISGVLLVVGLVLNGE